MTHLLLTRFNLEFRRWKNFRGNDPAWLDRRFDLFERICLPSVKAQTSQAFAWLVFFHPDTPQPYRDRISAMADAYPKIIPTFVVGIEGARAAAREAAGRFSITTRLDNDDAIAPGFVAAIQKLFARQQFQFVNVSSGAYVNAATGEVRRHRYPANMFLSLIEDTDVSRQTVMEFDHSLVRRDHSVLELDAPDPGWLVVVHGSNKSNRMRGTPANPALVAKCFPGVEVGS